MRYFLKISFKKIQIERPTQTYLFNQNYSISFGFDRDFHWLKFDILDPCKRGFFFIFGEKMPDNTHICEIKLLCVGIFSLYKIGCVSFVSINFLTVVECFVHTPH